MSAVQRYVACVLRQLYRALGPKALRELDRHHLPVNVRPPAGSCTPGRALSTMISAAVLGVIAKLSAPDVPPPGAGVATATSARPAAATASAAIVARS